MKLSKIRKILTPQSSDPDVRNRELVLYYLLAGTFLLAIGAFLATLLSLIVLHHGYMVIRVLTTGCFALAIAVLYYQAYKKHRRKLVATILSAIFLIGASVVAYTWGLLIPTGLLLFALSIVMAGVLINSRSSLYALALTVIIFIGLQYAKSHHLITPNLKWMDASSNGGDVFIFTVILAIITLVSYLFNHQMEQSLHRARQSEAELSRQKDLLEIKVEERTRELEAAQMEKVQQVYRFAELGRVSSALFHDLANHLTSVSLDIEGLEQSGRSKIMRRIQGDMRYIDDVVQRVRFQLRGQTEIEEFNVRKEIDQVIKILAYKTVHAHVTISIVKNSPKPILFTSDVTRFRQLIINLLSNAIEAYPDEYLAASPNRKVILSIEQKSTALIISVTDWGYGIKPDRRTKVFEPFYTDKKEGTGIGLFIVQQIVEQDLKGTITLTSSSKKGTVFTVRLPL